MSAITKRRSWGGDMAVVCFMNAQVRVVTAPSSTFPTEDRRNRPKEQLQVEAE